MHHWLAAGQQVTQPIIDKAIEAAKGAPSMSGLDLAKVVSVDQPYEWTESEWRLGSGYGEQKKWQISRGRLRLRRQEEHPAHAGRARLQGDTWCRPGRPRPK
jgi:hypothetical protein